MANERTKYIFAGGDDLSPLGRERGQGGLFRRTPQDGEWEPLTRGLPPHVEARAFAVDPKRVYCVTRTGQVFGTEDEGAFWREYPLPPNVVGRVRALACT